jgi:ribonuclease T2
MNTKFATKATSIVLLAALAISVVFLNWQPVPPERDRDAPAYYVLALSWSPTYCETNGRLKGELQCSAKRPYAFVLHGLWPQWTKGWPEYCPTAEGSFVPEKLVRSMLDIMPARRLVINQHRKHGTCTGMVPSAYFAKSRKLFEQIAIPQSYASPRSHLLVSAGKIRDDFLKANPELTPGMIAVSCGRRGRLRDVRVCYSRDFKPADCGANENPRRLCRSARITLPPLRGQAPTSNPPTGP